MTRLAFVMGRQGSGKTTRICHGILQRLRWWNFLHRLLLRPGCIEVRSNYFNHMLVGADGTLEFVTGSWFGKATVPLTALGRHPQVLEFPHSGFIPPEANRLLRDGGVDARIFVIELPEREWRSIDTEVCPITSPEVFRQGDIRRRPRATFDYAEDVARIRSQIATSGVPAAYFGSAEAMLAPIGRFLLWGSLPYFPAPARDAADSRAGDACD